MVAGLYGKRMFSSVGSRPALFQSGGPSVPSHQQRTGVPAARHPRQHLVVSVFWVLAVLIGVWWRLVLSLHFPDDI